MTIVTVRFFCIVFLVALLSQSALWWSIDFVDEWFWLEKIELLEEDLVTGLLVFDAKRQTTHPGTPVLITAAVLARGGLSPADSLRVVVTILNGMIIAVAVTLVRRLREKSSWWIGVAGVMLFNPIYEHVNPLDVVVSSLTVLIFLFLWLYAEKRRVAFMVAILLGMAAATRLHIALLLAGPVLGALVYCLGLKRAWLTSLGALATALVLMPYVWLSAGAFMQAAVFKQFIYFSDQTNYLVETSQLSLVGLIYQAPLAVASLLFATIALIRQNRSPLPRWLAITLLASTVVVLGVFWLSNLQSYRYVFPVLMVWEVMLPLFILHLMRQVRWPARRLVEVGVMLLLTGTYFVLQLYSLFLPEPVYI